MNMRILVTGGAGFIGSHLCERLLKEGVHVAIIDDFNTFYSPELKERNLHDVRRHGPIELFRHDIRDADANLAAIGSFKPDAVVHLAARAGVRPSLEQPLLYEQVNVGGTVGLLEACRKHGVGKFIFASSSSIYGVSNTVPFSVDDHLNLPISPYAATKIAGEKLCYTYSHLYGIQVVCLRFFTVYGPRQRPDLAIRKFTDMIWRGQPIPVFGDGSSGRDYTFIDDIVSGVVASINSSFAYEVFNLGNSNPVRLLEMIQTIERALVKPAVIKWLPEQPGDVPITYADISKSKRLLNYQPVTSFEAGVERLVAWYRDLNQDAGAQRAIA